MTEVLLLLAKATLSAVFAVAGIAKLRDAGAFRNSVEGFGVSSRIAPAVARLVPPTELAIAVGLLVPATEWTAGVVALAMLGLFTVGIGVNLVRGRTPDCRCFGQLSSQPIGPKTLVRNGVLVAVAWYVVAAGRERSQAGMFGSLAQLTGVGEVWLIAAVATLMLFAGQALLQWNLLQQHGRLLLRLDRLERAVGGVGGTLAPNRLPVGALAPAFDLPSRSGGTTSLASLLADHRPLLLVFSDPDCGACAAFLPTVVRWQNLHRTQVRIAVVSRATDELAGTSGLDTLLFQRDREVADEYGVPATPAGVLIRADGSVGSSVMLGGDAIATLLPAAAAPGAVGSNVSHEAAQ